MELETIKLTDYEGIDSLDDSSEYLVAKYTAWREEFKGRMQPAADPNCAWVVYAGTQAQRPQAAFSNKECADQLVLYMQGASDPVLRERSQIKAMSIVVDRYQEQICFGKMPYEIILNSQGEVFDSWGPSDGIPAIEEPVIMNEKLHAGRDFLGMDRTSGNCGGSAVIQLAKRKRRDIALKTRPSQEVGVQKC